MAEQIDNYLAEQEAAQRIEAERNQARLLAQQQQEAAVLAEQRMQALQSKKKPDGAIEKLAQGITAILQMALKAETTWFFAFGVAWINIHVMMSQFMPKLFVPLGAEDRSKNAKLPKSMSKMKEKILAIKDNMIHFGETFCCCLIIIIVLLIISAIVAAFDSTIGSVIGIFTF